MLDNYWSVICKLSRFTKTKICPNLFRFIEGVQGPVNIEFALLSKLGKRSLSEIGLTLFDECWLLLSSNIRIGYVCNLKIQENVFKL